MLDLVPAPSQSAQATDLLCATIHSQQLLIARLVATLQERERAPLPAAPPDAKQREQLRPWLADHLKAHQDHDIPPALLADIEGRLAGLPIEDIITVVEAGGGDRGRGVAPLYRAWIAANPASPHVFVAWYNLAVALTRADRKAEAVAAFQNVLAARPGFIPAATGLGAVLEALDRKEEALAVWQQALQPDDARVALFTNRGRVLEQMGRLEEAEQAYRSCLLTSPDQRSVAYQFVHLRQTMCEWPVLEADLPALPPPALMDAAGPLTVLALSDDIALQAQAGRNWIERFTTPVTPWLAPAEGYRHDRIRVGYLSSDFRRHAMAYLIPELFERHDRSRFEMFGYSNGRDDGSEIRQRIIRSFDHWRDIEPMTDEEVARAIRADEIDILVDLNGLTSGERTRVLRFKPAPVQATYLGYIGPVPLPELDYMFCDPVVVPPHRAAEYQPTPCYIGPFYQANDTRRAIAAAATRAEAGLPEDKFVFCCFSKHYKISEAMFAAWMTILSRAENSVLWLAGDHAPSERNLRAHARAHGVDPARLLFATRTPPEIYIRRLALADLFLDTFPYNSGTVASDALRMGLPLLTLAGESFVSRMATSLLTAMDAPDGIARSLPEYIETAVALATDRDRHAAFRAALGGGQWERTLGNMEAFTAEYEHTLQRIVRRPGA
jgi:predicted O-linked N-acetylglucosamine transferase (SPINDLY family)